MYRIGKVLTAVLALFLCLFGLTGCQESGKAVVNMSDSMISSSSTFKHEAKDFKKGTFTHTKLRGNELILTGTELSGEYESPVVEADAFGSFVASWNACTSEQSAVELQFQLRVEGQWSQWMSCGIWTQASTRRTLSAAYDLAMVDADTLIVSNNETATALKYKIILTRESEETASPSLRRVIGSMTFSVKKTNSISVDEEAYLKELAVPTRSQMTVADIGKNICSGTSLSMVLEYYGTDISTAEVAWGVRDYGANLFGNWSFNMAYAGEQGYEAYVEQGASFDTLKAYIADNMPVVLSVTTNESQPLDGAPMLYSHGHLLVLIGFSKHNGTLFAIVNDPAADNDEEVRHEYPADQLEKAWNHIDYVVKPET